MNNDQKQDLIFAEGFNIYTPPEQAKHFLFGKAGINVNKFKQFLDENVNEKGYVNLNFPMSKKTNEPYAVLDTYKPKPKQENPNERSTPTADYPEGIDISDIPW